MDEHLRRYIDKLAARPQGLPVDLLTLSPLKQKSLSRIDLEALKFLSLKGPGDLCKYVDVPFHEVEQCINHPGYIEIHLKKNNGRGRRLIEEPSMSLKKIQRRLNIGLGAVYRLVRPEQVHGFVRSGKGESIGIVSNAAVHADSAFVLNIDLKDFFHAVPAHKVKEVLSSDLFNFDEHLSIVIALLTTVNGRLPQGASTSPILSNFVCIPLDERLRIFAMNHGWEYSRYADDLTFSGSKPFSDHDLSLIRIMIESEGFRINDRKTRRKGASAKQKVTGLIVNRKVNVERKLIRKVRAMLYDARINGVRKASERHFNKPVDGSAISKYLNRIQGYVSFIGNVRGYEDPIYLKYRGQLRELFEKPIV